MPTYKIHLNIVRISSCVLTTIPLCILATIWSWNPLNLLHLYWLVATYVKVIFPCAHLQFEQKIPLQFMELLSYPPPMGSCSLLWIANGIPSMHHTTIHYPFAYMLVLLCWWMDVLCAWSQHRQHLMRLITSIVDLFRYGPVKKVIWNIVVGFLLNFAFGLKIQYCWASPITFSPFMCFSFIF
jgi:hypothetical protein